MQKTRKIALIFMTVVLMAVCFMFGASAKTVVEQGSCGEYGDNVTYVIYDDGEMVISGTGDMEDYESSWSGNGAFERKNLKSVVVEEGITYVGNYTFNNCETITSITLPDSIRSLGFYAFQNTGYQNIESNWEDGILYIGKHLIDSDYSFSGECRIKDGTRTISTYAFSNCKNLTSVKIPDSVISVGYRAFDNSGYYNNRANWDGKALYIDDCLVAVDSSLSGEFKVKDGTRVIAGNIFYDCKNLTSVIFPDSVEYIGREAFTFCDKLTNVTLGNGLKYIGAQTFSGCDGLTGSMVIPDSVEYIGDAAFMFGKFTNITIGNGVKYIGNAAFKYCSNITNIQIPESVTFLGDQAFYNCKKLVSINIPANIKTIGSETFAKCTSLGNVTIPETVETIGEKAFEGCKAQTNVTVLNKNIDLEKSGLGYDGSSRIAGFKVIGFENSTAYTYAKNHKFPFKSLTCATPSLVSINGSKNICTIEWNSLDNAEKYVVYRKTENSDWTKVYETTDTSYVDSTVQSGTVYYYTVSAYNEYGEGNYNTKGLCYAYIEAPESLVATANKDSVVFEWDMVENADGYTVYRKEGSKWKSVADTKETSYTDKSVSFGNKYTYTVKAYIMADGKKVVSDYDKTGASASFETVPTTKITSAAATKMTNITVKWEKVSVADQYYLYRSTKASSGYKCIKKTSSTSYVDKSVSFGKTYYYKVLVVADGKKSDFSDYKKVKAVLPTPELYTTFSVTSKSITLRWYKVAEATGYVIYRKTSDGDWKRIKSIKGNSTLSYKDSVTGGYYYKVYAYKTVSGKNQYSEPTKEIYLKTLKKTTIEVDQYKNELTDIITWSKVSGASHYQLYYKIGDGNWVKGETVGKNVTEYKFNVKHGKYYYWKVRPLYKKGSVTSVGEFSAEDNLIIYYTPDVKVFMSDDTDTNCYAVVVGLINEGSQTLRVYGKGAQLIDDNYEDYDRTLTMIDTDAVQQGYVKEIDYVDIKGGDSAILTFLVDGSPTWYDYKTRVRCTIRYDGVKHIARFSDYYGFHYYDY